MEIQAARGHTTLTSLFASWPAEKNTTLLKLPKPTCFEYKEGYHLSLTDSHISVTESKWLTFTKVIWPVITRDNLFLLVFFFFSKPLFPLGQDCLIVGTHQ